MFKKISNFFHALKFFVGVTWEKRPKKWKAKTKQVQKLSLKESQEKKRQARLLMHSLLKEGDSYKMGEATVTLAKFGVEGKKEVQAKIEAAAKRRAEKWEKARERGMDLMMMTPEQIHELKLDEWISKRKDFQKKLEEFDSIPESEPPSGEIRKNQ